MLGKAQVGVGVANLAEHPRGQLPEKTGAELAGIGHTKPGRAARCTHALVHAGAVAPNYTSLEIAMYPGRRSQPRTYVATPSVPLTGA